MLKFIIALLLIIPVLFVVYLIISEISGSSESKEDTFVDKIADVLGISMPVKYTDNWTKPGKIRNIETGQCLYAVDGNSEYASNSYGYIREMSCFDLNPGLHWKISDAGKIHNIANDRPLTVTFRPTPRLADSLNSTMNWESATDLDNPFKLLFSETGDTSKGYCTTEVDGYNGNKLSAFDSSNLENPNIRDASSCFNYEWVPID